MTRKQELVAIGKRLFEAHGYDRVRVEDILAENGMSKGGFYHHFASKEAVLRQIIADEMAALVARIQQREAEADAVERLAGVFLLGSSHGNAEAGILDTLQSFQARTVYLDESEAQFERHFWPVLADLIAEGVEAGTFRAVGPIATAEVFLAANNHVNRQAILGRRTTTQIQAFNRTALDLLARHLGIEARFQDVLDRLAAGEGRHV